MCMHIFVLCGGEVGETSHGQLRHCHENTRKILYFTHSADKIMSSLYTKQWALYLNIYEIIVSGLDLPANSDIV